MDNVVIKEAKTNEILIEKEEPVNKVEESAPTSILKVLSVSAEIIGVILMVLALVPIFKSCDRYDGGEKMLYEGFSLLWTGCSALFIGCIGHVLNDIRYYLKKLSEKK